MLQKEAFFVWGSEGYIYLYKDENLKSGQKLYWFRKLGSVGPHVEFRASPAMRSGAGFTVADVSSLLLEASLSTIRQLWVAAKI